MATSKQLILDIVARDKTKAGFLAAGKNAKGMSGMLRGVGTALAGIGLAAFAKSSAATFQSATKETLALNRATGGTVEATSRLRFAAKMSGQDMEKFTKSVGILDKNLVSAASTGKGKMFDAMQSLGVSFTDASGKVKPLTEVLPDMAEAFKAMPDGPGKAALALQLFGRSGMTILPFLNRGKQGINDLMAQTDEYNQVIGSDQVAAYKKNLEAQRKFDASIEGLKIQMGENLLPVFTEVVGVLGDVAHAFNGLDDNTRKVVVGLGLTAVAASALSGPIGAVTGGVKALGTALGGTAAAEGAAAAGGPALAPTLGILAPGLATVLGSAAQVYQVTKDLGGGFGAVSAFALQAGGPLNLVALAMGNSAREAEQAAPKMDALRDLMYRFATSGDTQHLTQAVTQLKQELGPEGYDSFIKSTAPEVQAAIKGTEDATTKLNEALKQAQTGFNGQSTKAAEYARTVVEAGRAAGKTDAEIRSMLQSIGATPRQVKIALSATPAQLNATLKKAQQDLNGLKQYQRPDIKAKVATLQQQLNDARRNVNNIKQNHPTDIKARDRATAEARRIQGEIDRTLHDVQVSVGAQLFVNVQTKKAPGGATGGRMSGMAIVGERGPELVTLPEGSSVFTHSQTRSMLGASSFGKGKKGKGGKNPPLTKAEQKWVKAQRERLSNKLGSAPSQADAWSRLTESGSAMDTARGSVRDSVFSFAGIGGWDPNARADAQAEAQAAQVEVNNSAVGSSARQDATARLTAARAKVASLPSSISDWVRLKVEKVRRWTNALGQLKNVWGSTEGGQRLMQEIYDKGPDGGTELAEELLKNPTELATLVNSSNEALSLADQATGYNPDYIKASVQHNVAQRDVDSIFNIITQLDGATLHKALLKLRRSQGGKALGLG